MLVFWALLTVLIPAGCSSISIQEIYPPDTQSKIQLFPSYIATGDTQLDILTFENNLLRKLDSYQSISNFDEDVAYVESTGGEKIIFFCSGGPYYKYEWKHINSYGGLNKMRSYLNFECKELPVRIGECMVKAGEDCCKVSLKPLVSKVQLATLSCDFSGTTYYDFPITDLKAYLINVNRSCPLIYTSPEKPEEVINHGRLSTEDMNKIKEPDILYTELTPKLDNIIRPEHYFLCMPNFGTEGEAGNPPTRLVIEGKIDGHTYYWPITIGAEYDKGTYIVERNCCYIYDVHIRRKGTTDPDIPININTGEIKLKVEPWLEKQEYGIEF